MNTLAQPARFSLSRLAARLALSLALSASPLLRADEPLPGQVDFGRLSPPEGGGQFVEVNINTALLSIAARVTEKQEPDVAELLRSLKSVRVNVIGLTDANRADLSERLAKLRTELDGHGWTRVVTVQEAKQEVGVYVKQRGEEAIEGIVITVIEGNKEAVLVNVVGDIKPEKIALLGERLNIEPLKKAGKAIKKSSA